MPLKLNVTIILAPTENIMPDIVYKVDAKKLSALISVKTEIRTDKNAKINMLIIFLIF